MLDANLKWAEQRNIHFPSAADGLGLFTVGKSRFFHILLLLDPSSLFQAQWRAEPFRRRWALSKFYPRQHFDLSQSLSLSSQHIYNTQHCNWQFAIIGMVSLFLRPFHLAHNTTIFTMYIITIENLLFTAGILSLSTPYTLHTPPYFCTPNFQFVWRDSQLSILVEE